MRWSYEELVVAQAKLNPLTKRQEEAQKQIDAIVARHESNPGDPKRLDDLKETLAVLSGLEARSARELKQYLGVIDRVLKRKMSLSRGLQRRERAVTRAAYVNRNFRPDRECRGWNRTIPPGRKTKCLFGAKKRYFGTTVSVFITQRSLGQACSDLASPRDREPAVVVQKEGNPSAPAPLAFIFKRSENLYVCDP